MTQISSTPTKNLFDCMIRNQESYVMPSPSANSKYILSTLKFFENTHLSVLKNFECTQKIWVYLKI